MNNSGSGLRAKFISFLSPVTQILFLANLFLLIFGIQLPLAAFRSIGSREFFFLAIVLWLLEFFLHPAESKKFVSGHHWLWFSSFLILAGCSLAGLFTRETSHPLFLAQMIRLVSNALALAMVLWYGSSFIIKKWLPITFALPILLFPLLYSLDSNLFLVSRYYIFRGLSENSTLLSIFLLPATIGSFVWFTSSRPLWSKILLFCSAIFSWALILSSNSRIAWLAAILGSLLGLVILRRDKLTNHNIWSAVGILAFIIILSFAILPPKLQLAILSRFSPNAQYHLYGHLDNTLRDASDIQKMKVSLSWSDFQFYPSSFFRLDGRGQIWSQAIARIIHMPFGSGPAYMDINPLNNGSLEAKTTHNIFLECLTIGGWLAFSGLIILLFVSFRSFPLAGGSWLAAAISGTSAALWLAFLGSDGIFLRWFWVFLGLQAILSMTTKNKLIEQDSSSQNDYSYRSRAIRFLAYCLDALGWALTFGFHRNSLIDKSKVRRILIIKLDHLGDCFLMTPLPTKLKQIFPAAEIDVACQKSCCSIFENNPSIQNILSYNYPRAYRGPYSERANFRTTFRFLSNVRHTHYDLVIDPRGTPFSAFASFFSGAPYRVGFEREEYGGFLYSHPLRYDPTQHETNKYRVILQTMGLSEAGEWQPEIKLSESEKVKAKELIKEKINEKFMVVQPGAGAEYKRWPTDNFAKVLDGLASDELVFVLLGGSSDQKIAEAIQADVKKARVLDLTGRLNIRESHALLSYAGGFLGNDSVLGHMAGVLGLPTLTLMNPGVLKARWCPLGSNVRVVSSQDSRHLCDYSKCPYPCPHMASISVSQVLEKIKEILN